MNNIIFSGLLSPYEATSIEPLKEFPLFKYGKNHAYHLDSGDSEIEFSLEDATRLMSNWLKEGRDLMVDYEHESLSGAPGLKKAAGWAKLKMKEDGLYASVEWTPAANEMLKNKELRYYSPAVQYSDEGLLDHMLPIAVTNTPALKNIPALMNSASTINTSTQDVNNTSTKDSNMSDKIETYTAADIQAMREEIEKIKGEKVAAQAEAKKATVEALLDKAQGEGRLAPAKRVEFATIAERTDVETLKLMLSALPVQIAAKAIVGAVETKTEDEELSDFQKTIIAERGYNTEEFLAEKRKLLAKFSGKSGLNLAVDEHKGKALAKEQTFFVGIK